jgi:hypothetical protein
MRRMMAVVVVVVVWILKKHIEMKRRGMLRPMLFV